MANEALKSLPFDETDMDLAVEPFEIPGPPPEDDDDALWWTGKEVVTVLSTRGLKTSCQVLRHIAIDMGIKSFYKGKTAHYSLTDVQMLQRELIRRAEAKKPRDSRAMCAKLSALLDEADNGRR